MFTCFLKPVLVEHCIEIFYFPFCLICLPRCLYFSLFSFLFANELTFLTVQVHGQVAELFLFVFKHAINATLQKTNARMDRIHLWSTRSAGNARNDVVKIGASR